MKPNKHVAWRAAGDTSFPEPLFSSVLGSPPCLLLKWHTRGSGVYELTLAPEFPTPLQTHGLPPEHRCIAFTCWLARAVVYRPA